MENLKSSNLKSNINWNSTITISVGDMLGIMTVTASAILGFRGIHKSWKNWVLRFYLNSVVLDLSTQPLKCNKSKKYRLITRTIYDAKLTDIFDNDHGIKKIQRAARGCTFSEPFIKIDPIQDQWYLYNKVISRVEQNYRISWFERDKALNKNEYTEKYVNQDPIKTEKYIFCMWCPYRWDGNLKHIVVDDITHMNMLKEYLRFIFRRNRDKTANFQSSKRIRGSFINLQFLETLIREIDINNTTDEQWQQLYDCGNMEKGSFMYHDRILRWYFIKRVAERYHRNEMEWANPLCTVEIPVPNGRHISIHKIQSSNIYHPYTYPFDLEQEKLYE